MQAIERISRAAKILSDKQADACGVDRENNWKIFGEDFIEDAKEAMSEVLAHIDKLEAEVERLRKDAERYRWLRNPSTDVGLVLDKRTGYVSPDEMWLGVGGYYTYEYRAGDELDAALDAARAQQKGGEPA